MALKAVVEDLEGVPEGLREHYTEGEGGKFYLVADGVDDLPSVRGLKSTLQKFKKVAPDASDLARKLERLEALKDVDPEEYQRLKDEAKKAGEKKIEKEGDFNALKEQMEAQQAKEIAKRDTEIARRDSFIERLLVKDKLDEAMTRIEVLPEYKDAVRALLMQRGPKVIREAGEDGDTYRAVFNTDMGEAEIGAYVETWGKSGEAAPFQKPSGTTGSGAEGSRGKGGAEPNPWAKDTFNLSKQGEVVRTDPAKAKRLAAAAGVVL